jgi:DNA-binding NarL/FixJ family response regulator
MATRVLLGGAGDIMTAGLGVLVSSQPGLEVVEGSPGRVAPDVVVYDVMGTTADDGQELWALIETGVPVVVLGRPLRPDLAARARAHGALAVVPMEADADELVRVILAAADGDLSDSAVHAVPSFELGAAEGLTPREVTVLAGITRGLSNREIGTELYIGQNTVKSTIRNAYRKIGVTTRAQAVSWCLRHGFDATTDSDTEEDSAAG